MNARHTKANRISALKLLSLLISLYDNHGYYLAPFLPGIVSTVHTLFQKQNGATMASLCIKIWSQIICNVLNDRNYFPATKETYDLATILKTFEKMENQVEFTQDFDISLFKNSPEINKDWLNISISKVKSTFLQVWISYRQCFYLVFCK